MEITQGQKESLIPYLYQLPRQEKPIILFEIKSTERKG